MKIEEYEVSCFIHEVLDFLRPLYAQHNSQRTSEYFVERCADPESQINLITNYLRKPRSSSPTITLRLSNTIYDFSSLKNEQKFVEFKQAVFASNDICDILLDKVFVW